MHFTSASIGSSDGGKNVLQSTDVQICTPEVHRPMAVYYKSIYKVLVACVDKTGKIKSKFEHSD